MVKRTVTETIYEYDKQGNLVKKTVTETHEEEDNTILTYPSTPLNPCPNTTPGDWWKQPYITWSNGTSGDTSSVNTTTTKLNRNDVVTDTTTNINI